VRGGQAMCAINLSGVWHDIESAVVQLPTRRGDPVWSVELSQRRRARLRAGGPGAQRIDPDTVG
jgi:hypothetical protein